MNAIYKFELTFNGNTSQCYPIYKDSLSKEYAKESGQEFFRAKLSGKLTFAGADYAAIMGAAFDTKFGIEIFHSNDAGNTWVSYWKGIFYKTDCDFDSDAQTIEVTPSVDDAYAAILDGQDNEYNLIDLAPEIREVKADKRPLIQIYTPGESVIACFLGGMWWEQECEAESNTNILTQDGDGKPNFALTFTKNVIEIDNAPADCPKVFLINQNVFIINTYILQKDGWTLRTGIPAGSGYPQQPTILTRDSDGAQWTAATTGYMPLILNLSPVSGTPASGTIELYAHRLNVYARILCDVDNIAGAPTYQIGSDDIVGDNRNYRRVQGFIINNAIFTGEDFSNTPTKWGLYEGKYYQPPYFYGAEFFPIARTTWGDFSLWFTYAGWSGAERNFEIAASQEFIIRHAYPLASVISVLLAKIAPNVSFGENAQYSEFFYGNNPPLTAFPYSFELLITPKSNIINSGYDTPAQKAPITLKEVFDMLRDCYRCYWFIDNGKLRIEHISYFMKGGSYSLYPGSDINLTNFIQYRNGKAWGFAIGKFSYDKPETTGRYQFGWMDDVTEYFNGFPIDVLSGYVDKEQIDEITVTGFTSDIDFVLLNPSEISKDGFVLLAPVMQNGELKLPYFDYSPDAINSHYLQNPFAAFCLLINYYLYDLPAPDCEMNGYPLIVYGTKRLKSQNIKFPCKDDPDLQKLVQTSIGMGQFSKLSVNLCSRIGTATLKYDTE